ncbi:MAG: flavodoxin domain-containing protein, partial [Bacteroidota bacterium]|nr:flavodoxin domain-containing protein [Bacteroidota bacterium]
MKKQVKNNVYWVGKNHWDLREFHGSEFTTRRGSSYNSYLILEEKIGLIDTVYEPFSNEFVKNLSSEIDLKKIDFIVVNHAEPDHSGALKELLDQIPGTPVYCTENGIKSLTGLYHQPDWKLILVKTGDKIDVGNGKELIFIQAAMIHWPDSMFCFLTGDNILFSNDAFGQHYCSELLFNDLVDQGELWAETYKYYANIVNPFSHLVARKLDEIAQMGIAIECICPSHGIVWRDNPSQVLEKYAAFAAGYQENQITVIYDTMYHGTQTIADNIVKGITLADPLVNVKLYSASATDLSDLIVEIFKSKAILIGSPTVHNGVLYTIAGLMEFINGMKFKNKKAASFGTYGWHDVSSKIIQDGLKEAGFELILEPISANWRPDK